MKNYLKDIGFAAFLLFLAVLLLLSLFWALSIGTVKLPAGDIYDAVLHQFTSGLPIEATGQGRSMTSYGFFDCRGSSWQHLSEQGLRPAGSSCRRS